MNATSLRDSRAELDLTQHGLAKQLKMGRWGWQTVSGWETGKRPIPGPVQVAIEGLLRAQRDKGDGNG